MAVKRHSTGITRAVGRTEIRNDGTLVRWDAAAGGESSDASEPVGNTLTWGGGTNNYDEFFDPTTGGSEFEFVEIYVSGFDGDDGSHLDLRLSTDGSTIRAGASDYSYGGRFMDGTSTNLNNNTNHWRCFNATGAVGNERVHGILKLYGIAAVRRATSFTALTGGNHSDGSSRSIYVGGTMQGESTAQHCRGFRVFSAGGTPDGGKGRGFKSGRTIGAP